jgi:hypothetical protein
MDLVGYGTTNESNDFDVDVYFTNDVNEGPAKLRVKNDSELESSLTEDDEDKHKTNKSNHGHDKKQTQKQHTKSSGGDHRSKNLTSPSSNKKSTGRTKKRVTSSAKLEQREGGEIEDSEEQVSTPDSVNQRIPSISEAVPEALAVTLPPVSSIAHGPQIPPLKTPPLPNNPPTLPSISPNNFNNTNWRVTSGGARHEENVKPLSNSKGEERSSPSVKQKTPVRSKKDSRHEKSDSRSESSHKSSPNMQQSQNESSLPQSYMGYSNLNQDSDEETDFKPQKTELSSSKGESSRGTKRSRPEVKDDSDDSGPDEDNNRRTKRVRKRKTSVQRAIEDERREGKREKPKKSSSSHSKSSKKSSSSRKSSKSSSSKNSKKQSEEVEDEKLPDDGVLAIDKFLLKRYNTNTKQCEYLVQWNGFDIHRSTWLAKHDIFAADYLNEFEEEWSNRLKHKKDPKPSKTEGEEEPVIYEVGDQVWVKLKGHQWWPAQIVVHSEVDNGKNDYTVVFYGDNTFAFVNDYEPKDFTIERFEQSNAAKYIKKQNEKAIKEALAMLSNGPE